jgi:predicted ATPase
MGVPENALIAIERSSGDRGIPLRTVSPSVNRVEAWPPHETDPFFGRHREILELRQILESDARLCTVFGPGGMGKSRLARRVLTMMGAPLVVVCDLSGITDLDPLSDALAVALDLDEGASPEQISRALAAEPTHLVLDNLDDLDSEGIRFIRGLLDLAPKCRMVVSSRHALSIKGETRYPLGPLDADAAVELFISRARATDVRFEATPDMRAIIAQINARLDCNPLAIELAAARVGILEPQEIFDRLANAFHLLRTRCHDTPSRHASLELCFELSWAKLNAFERQALAECCAFPESFTLHQAERIVQIADLPVLEIITALCNRSFIQVLCADGKKRFRVYQNVRRFVAMQPGFDAFREAAERRFASDCIAAAEQSLERLNGEARLEALLQLKQIRDDLLVVHARGLERAPKEAGKVSLLLFPLLLAEEEYALAERLLAGAAPLSQRFFPEIRPQLLQAQAELALRSGAPEKALSLIQLAEEGTSRAREASSLAITLSQVHARRGDSEGVRAALQKALVASGEIPDPALEAEIQAKLGQIPFEHRFGILSSLEHPLVPGYGHPIAEALRVSSRGRRLIEGGAFERGEELCLRAHHRLVQLGDAWLAARVSIAFARSSRNVGRFDEALAAIDRGERLHAKVDPSGLAEIMLERGMIAHDRGDLSLAEEYYASLEGTDRWPRIDACAWRRRGLLFLEKNNAASALECFRSAGRAGARGPAQSTFGSLVQLGLASSHALLGDVNAAEEILERMSNTDIDLPHVGVCSNVMVDLARAAEPSRSATEVAALLEEARRQMVLLASASESSSILRVYLRVLHSIVDRIPMADDDEEDRPNSEATKRAVERADGPILVLNSPRRCFELDEGPRVDLTRRRSPWLVLRFLAEQRIAAPGRGAPLNEVVAAGWPNERIIPRAASSRVYFVICELRRAGLQGVLLTSGGGYLIDPQYTVTIIE